ncbi:MAG TPA: heat-inducible transcriptional repressor HrcA [Terriglobia bacterium]|nr:heat-inducible transcriptional repressor HrcA [Terriglobia bacterium]
MKVQFDLSGRDREVLVALVRQFIAHGFPVGSKVLAAQMPTPVSSATIRSVLGALEDGGFLTQPHVSAGRVPTEKAYRFYVDRVVRGARLAPDTERYIDQTLRSDSDRPERLMTRASRTLSEVSRNVGLVLVPTMEEKLLEHIKFINLPDHRILVVIVSKPDVVENRVVRLEETFTQDELDQAANFLNAEFHGWSLGTIRLEVFHRLEADKILYARRLKNVATLFMWGALSQDEAGGLIVDGTAKVLERPEFADVQKVKELVRTLEEKAKLARILEACLQIPDAGVRILIGRENAEKQMHHCALVVAPLHYRNRAVGALGVVGPMRMEYDRAVGSVEYIAQLCSRLLSSN